MNIVEILLEKYIEFKEKECKKYQIPAFSIVLMICICVSALASFFCIFKNLVIWKTVCIIFEGFFTVVMYLYVEKNIKKSKKIREKENENFIKSFHDKILSKLKINSANQIIRLINQADEMIKSAENTFDIRKNKVNTVINSVIVPLSIAIVSSYIGIKHSSMEEMLVFYIDTITCIIVILITSSAACEIIDFINARKKSVNLINLYTMRNDLNQIVNRYYLFSDTYEQIAGKKDGEETSLIGIS